VVTSTVNGRRVASPHPLTKASQQGDAHDGAWWPHTASVARELPELIEAVKPALGRIVDIDVNWSSLAGMPNLDSLNWRGNAAVIGAETRHQRVMTLTGSRARARILVVPPRTSTALAVMLLRRAARLPIVSSHQHTEAFRIADVFVRSVCAAEPSDTASAADPS
jgi:hypothetical protein